MSRTSYYTRIHFAARFNWDARSLWGLCILVLVCCYTRIPIRSKINLDYHVSICIQNPLIFLSWSSHFEAKGFVTIAIVKLNVCCYCQVYAKQFKKPYHLAVLFPFPPLRLSKTNERASRTLGHGSR